MTQPLSNSPALSIEIVKVSDLVKNPRSARKHDEKQKAKLAKSIDKFGFVEPVIVDETNAVLSGNARIEAAEQLNMQTVPIIRLTHLSEAEKRAFILAVNRLPELAKWDLEILRSELQYLTDFDIDFDFQAIGFDTAEIDVILDGSPTADSKDDDLSEPVFDAVAVSHPGDLWILGEHRLFCGNALDSSAFVTLLGAERARAVIMDSPYNVPIDGHVGGLGTVKHREFAMASGEMSGEQFTDFLRSTFMLCAEFSIDGSLQYVFMDWRHTTELLAAAKSAYTEHKNICVWTKTNAGMGSLYRSQHEFVHVFKSGTAPHINNIELGVHGRPRTNVWSYQGINSFGAQRDTLLALHPTVKPVALIADAIKDCSKRGDIILDPFGGSGTTLIAAEKTKRRAALIELDPLYCDVIIRRWQTFTGKTAVCAATGVSFGAREINAAALALQTPPPEPALTEANGDHHG